MKPVLILLALIFINSPAPVRADVRSPETHATTELVLITANSAVSFINVAAIASSSPLTWAIGLGMASGLTSVIYSVTAEHLEHETAVPASGLAAMTIAVLSLGFRHGENQVQLEPHWHNGSPGLALAIDF